MNNSIIHVKKKLKNNDKAQSLPDYVTVLTPQKTKFKVSQNKTQTILKTDLVKVIVNNDGVIEFETKKGKGLLSETNEVTYIKPDNTKGDLVSQSFVAGDEGLYGLGQFQSGVMNWKNTSIRLQQDNQEIAIPFIVSTKGYGIYWHNYSVTDFNLPEHEIAFANTSDEKKNVREATFTPAKTGMYSFMAETNSANKRTKKPVIQVDIDGENIINYTTFWAPVCFSGKKYLEAGKSYKVMFQNTGSKEQGRLLYNEPDYNKTVFSSETGNSIDYYFVYGENPMQVISQYQLLTGKAPMFDKSALGFWQCRERYHDQAELLENAREYRKREIPVDYIVQDWFYWPKGTKGPEWDREKYPNPKSMVDSLTKMHYKLMVSVWPEVNNEPMMKKYNLDKQVMTGTHFLDLYNEDVQKRYYKMISDSMFHIGVTSIWLDGSEPENKPANDYQTAVGPFGAVANPYSIMVTKSMYEGKRKEFPNQRVFNLTRSAYAGQQRYGVASWSGDVNGTWRQFSEQIASGLNFVMAGVPYWTTDIGGFFRDSKSLNPVYDDQYTNVEYKELLTRWFQFGAFCPVFRIHGYVSNTEIWRYGQEFEDMARKFIDIRYQLMPYTYSEAWKVTTQGKLLLSPMVYQYPNDKNTWGIKDQFFFGESMLICPITEYNVRNKEVYLPKGEWFDFWTGTKIPSGAKVNAITPLNQLPVYVKSGSIIPMGPKVQYANEPTKEPLLIKIYSGKNAEYTLYLDDNTSYNYEKGIYSEVKFIYSESENEITMSKGNGNYIDFTKNPMIFNIQKVGSESIKKVIFNGIKKVVKL
ncbi:Alpha-xylosidase [Arcticibacter svalbardensis MN12-7]|uniref:Alpha-xylosidase n=2 Tax=Arcticibacter TaxID=1288026 RepID=R9GQC0_9SPHI|nr:Alpha-xylosidase [Arcticibacter svalbardensis MN12-7]